MLILGVAWGQSPAEEPAEGKMKVQEQLSGTRATKGDTGWCSARHLQGI